MFAKLKQAYEVLRQNIRVYAIAMRDPRTPRLARWLLWLAIGYLVSPIDLIPDFIPVLGYADDILIVPTLFILARRMIPQEVIDDARNTVNNMRKERSHHNA